MIAVTSSRWSTVDVVSFEQCPFTYVEESLARLAAERFVLVDHLGHERGWLDEVHGEKAALGILDPSLGDELCRVDADVVEQLEGLVDVSVEISACA